jgi:hypothetical protein
VFTSLTSVIVSVGLYLVFDFTVGIFNLSPKSATGINLAHHPPPPPKHIYELIWLLFPSEGKDKDSDYLELPGIQHELDWFEDKKVRRLQMFVSASVCA